MRNLLSIALLVVTSAFIVKPVTWKLKEGYIIEVKHDGFIVGNFTGLKATII